MYFYNKAHELQPFLHGTLSGSKSPAPGSEKNSGTQPAVLSGAQSCTTATRPRVPGAGMTMALRGHLCPGPTLLTSPSAGVGHVSP